jgi:RNA polymerase sigma-70 factor (ECF subfamily)
MKIDPKHISFADLVIRTQVKWLRERGIIRRSEAEDFASDLMAQLLEAWDGFDPERGTREAFINQVVSTRILSLLRDRRAQKRRGNPLSLDVDGDSIADPAGAGDAWIRTIDLRVDLEAARRKLSPKQRALCDQLLREALSPASREMGVPRSTLRYAVTKIRQIFRDAGLEEYL